MIDTRNPHRSETRERFGFGKRVSRRGIDRRSEKREFFVWGISRPERRSEKPGRFGLGIPARFSRTENARFHGLRAERPLLENSYSLICIKAPRRPIRHTVGMNGQLSSPALHFTGFPQTLPEYTTELDARSATPPNHLISILTALAALPAGAPQWVRTRTEPSTLIRALSDQGVVAQATELPDGSWRTILHRPAKS